jgi:hypothetical protein
LHLVALNATAGQDFVVAADVDCQFSRRYDSITIKFINLKDLIKTLSGIHPETTVPG